MIKSNQTSTSEIAPDVESQGAPDVESQGPTNPKPWYKNPRVILVVTLVVLVLTLCIALPFIIKRNSPATPTEDEQLPNDPVEIWRRPTVKDHADATKIQSLARMRAQQKDYRHTKAATKIQRPLAIADFSREPSSTRAMLTYATRFALVNGLEWQPFNKPNGPMLPVGVPAMATEDEPTRTIQSAAPEAEANSDSEELRGTDDQTAAEYTCSDDNAEIQTLARSSPRAFGPITVEAAEQAVQLAAFWENYIKQLQQLEQLKQPQRPLKMQLPAWLTEMQLKMARKIQETEQVDGDAFMIPAAIFRSMDVCHGGVTM